MQKSKNIISSEHLGIKKKKIEAVTTIRQY